MREVSWYKSVDSGRTRIYTYLRLHEGIPRAFVIQIECRLDGEWRQVVRFDHDMDLSNGHDVREEGLHMDVYRDGQKIRVEWEFPEVELTEAPAYCARHIKTKHDEYIERYIQWQP